MTSKEENHLTPSPSKNLRTYSDTMVKRERAFIWWLFLSIQSKRGGPYGARRMIGTTRNWHNRQIAPLILTIAVIIAGFLGWFVIKYPAHCGYVSYEVHRQFDFSLYDAEQALVSQGYSVKVDHAPTDYHEWPYLETNDFSPNGDMTSIWIYVEYYYSIYITAHRKISIPPYAVIGDLHELSREHQQIAEGDVRDVLDIVGVPSTGTFTFSDDIDSLDFFMPTTVFYIFPLIFFPTLGLSILALILSNPRRQERTRPPIVKPILTDNSERNS